MACYIVRLRHAPPNQACRAELHNAQPSARAATAALHSSTLRQDYRAVFTSHCTVRHKNCGVVALFSKVTAVHQGPNTSSCLLIALNAQPQGPSRLTTLITAAGYVHSHGPQAYRRRRGSKNAAVCALAAFYCCCSRHHHLCHWHCDHAAAFCCCCSRRHCFRAIRCGRACAHEGYLCGRRHHAWACAGVWCGHLLLLLLLLLHRAHGQHCRCCCVVVCAAACVVALLAQSPIPALLVRPRWGLGG